MTGEGSRMLLDAPSLGYRAFFALPTSLQDGRGRSVNAVRGFLDMVGRLAVERRPGELVAVFDADWRPEFRVAAYAPYKSQRPDDPPELEGQFDVLARVLDAAGVVRAESPALEADDAIATLVERSRDRDTDIVTGDRDLLSLVRDPNIRLVWPTKGVREVRVIDEAAVRDKYGVPPELYGDFATLRGDSSDNLPGVAGVGPVRAAKLLATYGSIDGILEHLQELPGAQARAFSDAAEYLAAMKTVVPLVRDADLRLTEPHEPDEGRLRALGEEHNLGSSMGRFLRSLKALQDTS